jgi:hypothetical protein
MQPEQIAAFVPQATTSAVLAFVGLWALSFPGCFAAVRSYFSRVNLPPIDEKRLNDVLSARKDAENIPMWLGRALGLVSLALAVPGLVPHASPAVSYAAWCVAFAAATAFACMRFRQAAKRRVALLVPRDPLAALPLPVPAAIAACIVVEISLAIVSPFHTAWAAVAVASSVLVWIAWQIAMAPALILGNDVPVETYVDSRLRAARTMNVAGLAIVPAIALLGATHDFSQLGTTAWVIATVAAGVASVYLVRATQSIDSNSALAAMSGRI